MARFDIHALRAEKTLVVDVQSELLDPLNTRVVVPLLPRTGAQDPNRPGIGRPAERLNPVFVVDDEPLVFAPQFLAAVPKSALGPAQGSLAAAQDTIRDALDMVFTGF